MATDLREGLSAYRFQPLNVKNGTTCLAPPPSERFDSLRIHVIAGIYINVPGVFFDLVIHWLMVNLDESILLAGLI